MYTHTCYVICTVYVVYVYVTQYEKTSLMCTKYMPIHITVVHISSIASYYLRFYILRNLKNGQIFKPYYFHTGLHNTYVAILI